MQRAFGWYLTTGNFGARVLPSLSQGGFEAAEKGHGMNGTQEMNEMDKKSGAENDKFEMNENDQAAKMGDDSDQAKIGQLASDGASNELGYVEPDADEVVRAHIDGPQSD